MLLTLTDAGIRNIGIHGGKNLTHFIAATRHFVYRYGNKLLLNYCTCELIVITYRTNTTVNVHELEENSAPYQDKNLTITPVIVHPVKRRKRDYKTFSTGSDGSMSSSDGYESSSSSSGSNDSEIHFKKNPVEIEQEAQAYRKKVVSLMFTNSNKGQKAPGHTIEADCTPRALTTAEKTAHPLADEQNKVAKVMTNTQRDYLMKALPRTKPSESAITYICQGVSVPRKFNKAAALALGIKPGPVYGDLQKGIDVTLPDGTVVTRDMVCDPEVPGHVFVVVDCPNSTYIDGLVNSKAFDKYLDPNGKLRINVMIHHLGNNVIHDDRYKKWLMKFDTATDVSF